MKSVRAKAWCFTNNNPDGDKELYINIECKYIIVGDEHKTVGTHHHQGYIYFNKSISFNTVKKILPNGCHIEKANGSPKQASNYCKKECILYEAGELPIQGKRNDIHTVKELINENKHMSDIIDNIDSYQAIKCAELILKYKEIPRKEPPTVYWFYGKTGLGKTRLAIEMCTITPWISSKDLKWWCGYDRHENIIIDDFRADFCTFHELLRILDRYPYRVQTKGGSRELVAKNIFITSAYPPSDIYIHCGERVDQLLRRITHIRDFNTEPYRSECNEVKGNTTP